MAWLGVVEMVELITLPRTTVQQALEALENLYLTLPPETVLAKSLDRRIMNLKAALEQPEQEPVEIKPPNQEGSSTCTVRWTIETPAGWIGAWDKEALEQFSYVFRKPVAWRYKSKESMPWSLSDDSFYISCKRDKGYIVEPLYNLLLDGRSCTHDSTKAETQE